MKRAGFGEPPVPGIEYGLKYVPHKHIWEAGVWKQKSLLVQN